MEIAPNVQQIVVGEGAFTGVYAPNVYLVAGQKRVAFIDSAYGKDEEVKAHLDGWESQGRLDLTRTKNWMLIHARQDKFHADLEVLGALTDVLSFTHHCPEEG